LRAINSAELTFALTCGSGFYAPNLTTLGTPPPGSNEPFIGGGLGEADVINKSGYTIQVEGTALGTAPAACNGLAAGMASKGLGRGGSNGCRYRYPALFRKQLERCDLRGRRLAVRRDARGRPVTVGPSTPLIQL
jgi:hypothetical protein